VPTASEPSAKAKDGVEKVMKADGATLSGLTTKSAAAPLTAPEEATTWAVPGARPVASPAAVTVATAGWSTLHATSLAKDRVSWSAMALFVKPPAATKMRPAPAATDGP
jgi:hypothetical protein